MKNLNKKWLSAILAVLIVGNFISAFLETYRYWKLVGPFEVTVVAKNAEQDFLCEINPSISVEYDYGIVENKFITEHPFLYSNDPYPFQVNTTYKIWVESRLPIGGKWFLLGDIKEQDSSLSLGQKQSLMVAIKNSIPYFPSPLLYMIHPLRFAVFGWVFCLLLGFFIYLAYLNRKNKINVLLILLIWPFFCGVIMHGIFPYLGRFPYID